MRDKPDMTDTATDIGQLHTTRFTPDNCPHCEYDRKFPGFERGGWIQQDNNGPIVSCPMCNGDGKHAQFEARGVDSTPNT